MLNAHCSKLAVFLLATAGWGLMSGASESTPSESKRFVPASLARFELVLGRLQLSTEHFRIGAAFERSLLEDGRERIRSISISTYRGRPTLLFRDSGGDEEVQLSFRADRKVDIQQSVGSDRNRYTLIYHQSDEGPVAFSVVFYDGRDPLEFKSSSLWHLALEQPQVFDEYLRPCLARLDPNWPIKHLATTIRPLKKSAEQESDTQAFDRLIEQLDADLSKDRSAAMSQLEAMGVTAEPRLRQSLSTDLTSQQEQSVRRLLSSLQPVGNDTPMRIAVWLSGELQ
jgi:hypothetical protein